MLIIVIFVVMNPCFAIINRNTLGSLALRGMLWDIYDHVEVHIYKTLEDMIRDSNRHFVHFFVSTDILSAMQTNSRRSRTRRLSWPKGPTRP